MGLPGWPGGDPDDIRAAAKEWTALHDSLLDAVDSAAPVMTAMFGDWSGDAAKSFETTWSTFSGTHRKAATGAAAVSKALDSYADKLEEAHKKYEHMVEAMAATAVVGIGLAIFTGGLSAAAGAAAEASVAAEITALLVDLGVEIETVISLATAAAEAAGAAAECAVGFAVDFSIGFAMSAGDQALQSGLDGDGISVQWDQAAIAGLGSAALGPLLKGKTLPVRMAIGGAGTVATGAISQLDDLLLHGGLKKGEGLNVDSLLIDLLAGMAGGAAAKGPSAAEMRSLQDMVDGLADNPAIADLITRDPDWMRIYATNPDIMRVVTAGQTTATVAISPHAIEAIIRDVRVTVIDIRAPHSLATYTSEAVADVVISKGIDVSSETIKQAMEVEVEHVGGSAAVARMSPAELKALADRIAQSIPAPKVPAHGH